VLGFGEAPDDEGASKDDEGGNTSPAGPHAKPELTNPDVTPGTGMLPPVETPDDPNMQPTS
jgi:hypothetical protein